MSCILGSFGEKLLTLNYYVDIRILQRGISVSGLIYISRGTDRWDGQFRFIQTDIGKIRPVCLFLFQVLITVLTMATQKNQTLTVHRSLVLRWPAPCFQTNASTAWWVRRMLWKMISKTQLPPWTCFWRCSTIHYVTFRSTSMVQPSKRYVRVVWWVSGLELFHDLRIARRLASWHCILLFLGWSWIWWYEPWCRAREQSGQCTTWSGWPSGTDDWHWASYRMYTWNKALASVT